MGMKQALSCFNCLTLLAKFTLRKSFNQCIIKIILRKTFVSMQMEQKSNEISSSIPFEKEGGKFGIYHCAHDVYTAKFACLSLVHLITSKTFCKIGWFSGHSKTDSALCSRVMMTFASVSP